MHLTRTPLGLSLATPSGELLLRHFIGIGKNYADHAKEMGGKPPEHPVLFTKNPLAACLSGEEIVVPKICQDRPQVDFEAELAVILAHPQGKPLRDISKEQALSCVVGYTAANDVSARWWQKEGSGGQFNRGKSFDTFCPLGPTVVPAKDIADPQALRIVCRVNGQEMQNASTKDMIFSVATLIHECTRGTTLLPGTVLLTGTPSGVGFARTPPVFLKHGDRVEVDIAGIGTLTNTVRFE